MIKIENTEVYGWEAAIRGMRNPMNSWDKSDSAYDDPECENCPCLSDLDYDHPQCQKSGNYLCPVAFVIGENDLKLMKSLIKAGSDHRKFMRQIFVSVDITAPLYWFKEFDTYKVGTTANSCSTMHKIHAKEFELDDFSHDRLNGRGLEVLNFTICRLNQFRILYNETHEKDWWEQIIQTLPSSYNQKRTITMNYEVLLNMYHARKAHKLDEWRVGFCNWIKTLPYSELITGEEK